MFATHPWRHAQVLRSLFDALDIHEQGSLNDLQFLALLKCASSRRGACTYKDHQDITGCVVVARRTMTNLKEAQCYRLFDMLDLDKSGAIDSHASEHEAGQRTL